MNHVLNDRGQRVVAVRASGSEERLRCEYPALIERLTQAKQEGKSAIVARLAIRREGIQTMLEIGQGMP